MALDSNATIRKATDLLFYMNARRVPLGVSELAKQLGAPKTSTHRLLASLRYRDLVEQDPDGRYRLGIGLTTLSAGVSGDEPLLRAGHDVLRSAASALQETFFLVVARGGALIVVDKAEGSGFLRVSPSIGSHVPLSGTAVGRIYRAFAPETVAAVASDDSREAALLVQCRTDRVARSYEEWQAGLSAIAAPIFLGQRLVGALVAALIGPRLREVGEARVVDAVRTAAKGVELRMVESS